MEGADILSATKDALLGLSAIAVTVLAWKGLKTWRKELTGKAKFETARSMMRLGSKLRSSCAGVRHPFTMSYEWADRTPQDKETQAEAQVLNEWYAKAKRLSLVAESLNEVIETEWEAEILLDESSAKAIKEAVQSYRQSYGDLSSAISAYFDITYDGARTGSIYKDQEWLKGLHKTIYSVGNGDFSKKVDNATDKLSDALKQYVR